MGANLCKGPTKPKPTPKPTPKPRPKEKPAHWCKYNVYPWRPYNPTSCSSSGIGCTSGECTCPNNEEECTMPSISRYMHCKKCPVIEGKKAPKQFFHHSPLAHHVAKPIAKPSGTGGGSGKWCAYRKLPWFKSLTNPCGSNGNCAGAALPYQCKCMHPDKIVLDKAGAVTSSQDCPSGYKKAVKTVNCPKTGCTGDDFDRKHFSAAQCAAAAGTCSTDAKCSGLLKHGGGCDLRRVGDKKNGGEGQSWTKTLWFCKKMVGFSATCPVTNRKYEFCMQC